MRLDFRLVLVTDWGLADLASRLEQVLAQVPGVAVQHRHPAADDRQFFEEGQALAALCARYGAPLFINRRLDVALLLGAHLHLPASGLAVADVRPHLPGRLVSLAVHGAHEAQAGADLALVSPVFPPGSKPDDTRPPLGVAGFHALAATLPYPAFALGGIDPWSARGLRGAAGLAAISGVLRAEAPAAAARGVLEALDGR